MSSQRNQSKLLNQLFQDGESFFHSGVITNIIDISLTILTVIASLVATILAAAAKGRVWLMVAAALPAAITGIQQTVDIRGRSNWYFLYAAKVRVLEKKLEYSELPNVEKIAAERADLELAMENEWPKIGHSLAARKVRKSRNRDDS